VAFSGIDPVWFLGINVQNCNPDISVQLPENPEGT